LPHITHLSTAEMRITSFNSYSPLVLGKKRGGGREQLIYT